MEKHLGIKCSIFLIILLMLASCSSDNPEPKPASPVPHARILSDTGGAIEEIALQNYHGCQIDVISVHMSLINAMHPDTIFHIALGSKKNIEIYQERIKKWKIKKPGRIKLYNIKKPITPWARDRFMVTAEPGTDGKITIVRPWLGTKVPPEWLSENPFPDLIAKNSKRKISIRQTELSWQGGNFVASDSHIFSAYNTVPYLMTKTILSPAEAEQLLEVEFGRKGVVLGDKDDPVPAAHIDMYLTPIDNKTLILGDPELGEQLFLESFRKNAKDKAAAAKVAMPRPAATLAPYYDKVRRMLEERGFTVKRIPLVACRKADMIMTYNNVLMERRDGVKYVYMPTYGIIELDGAALNTYESLGFTVVPIDVSRIYQNQGAIRCLTNVISRKEH